jgi:hypothetical protein
MYYFIFKKYLLSSFLHIATFVDLMFSVSQFLFLNILLI